MAVIDPVIDSAMQKRYFYTGGDNDSNRLWLIWLIVVPVVCLILYFALMRKRKRRVYAVHPNQQYYGGQGNKPQQGGFNFFGWGGHQQPQGQPQGQGGYGYQPYSQLLQQYGTATGGTYGNNYQQQSYSQQYQPTDEHYGDPPPMYPADEAPSGSSGTTGQYSRPPGPPPGNSEQEFSRPPGPPPAHVK